MNKQYCYPYPRPAVATDIAVFGYDPSITELQVLLIRRGANPFKNKWSLPGGFLHYNESPDAAARRELYEETTLSPASLLQVGVWGEPNRDPREHVVTIAYLALVSTIFHAPQGGSDASDAKWFSLEDIPDLAFDHGEIMQTALQRLRHEVSYTNLGFSLLPSHFRLRDLQRIHEIILGESLDKRNFRKKWLESNLVEPTGEIETDVQHRAAQLYRYVTKEKV